MLSAVAVEVVSFVQLFSFVLGAFVLNLFFLLKQVLALCATCNAHVACTCPCATIAIAIETTLSSAWGSIQLRDSAGVSVQFTKRYLHQWRITATTIADCGLRTADG